MKSNELVMNPKRSFSPRPTKTAADTYNQKPLIIPIASYLRHRITTIIVRLLAVFTPYVESELLGLPKIVKAGDVCIDVGAAAGLYTVELSRLVGSKGRVISVEPLSIAHPKLSRLLGSRRQHNVAPRNIALGAVSGKSIMSVPIGRYGPVTGRSFLASETSTLGSNDEFRQHMNVKIKVDTIDKLCSKANLTRLDFIKIDIEGAELNALKGGRKYIERYKPAILVEIEARHLKRFGYHADDIIDWLSRFGYKMYTWQHGWRQTEKVTLDKRNYLFKAK